jgi:hypothetical protein
MAIAALAVHWRASAWNAVTRAGDATLGAVHTHVSDTFKRMEANHLIAPVVLSVCALVLSLVVCVGTLFCHTLYLRRKKAA